jgi:hypothetical protein
VIPVKWVVNHCFNKFFYIKEPLNNFHAIMRIDGKTHCITLGVIGVGGLGGTV